MNNFDNHFKEFIWDRITSRWEAEGINPEHEAAEKRADDMLKKIQAYLPVEDKGLIYDLERLINEREAHPTLLAYLQGVKDGPFICQAAGL